MTLKQEVIKINKDIEIIGDLCGTSWDRTDYDICDCGNKKLRYRLFCDKCENEIEEKFKRVMQEQFNEKEIEIIDNKIEGCYLKDYLKGE